MSAPRLERIASEVEAILLAMPIEAQIQTRDGISQLIDAARALQILPPEIVGKVWSVLVTFVITMQMPRTKASKLVRQIFDGAPNLFPPGLRTRLLAELDAEEGGTTTEIASCPGLQTKPAQ